MEVILLERIERLGQMGDVVTVKNGYARNYLLPQGKALRSSKENLAIFEAKRKEYEAYNAKIKAEAEELAKKLTGLSVMIIRQAAESGQLYGSVTARDIFEAICDAGVKIERHHVALNQPFKNIGIFDVNLVLHPDVTQTVRVNIARSTEEGHQLAKKQGAKKESKESKDSKESKEVKAPEVVEETTEKKE